MHHDDSIQTVSLAGHRVLVVRCDEQGRIAPSDLAARWAATDATFVWLGEDGSGPTPSEVAEASDDVVTATLVPVVDAVKRVDGHTIVETVDRSTLSAIRPPALIPAAVVERVLTADTARNLLGEAVRLAGVVGLSPGA